jgi:hypothetical protein
LVSRPDRKRKYKGLAPYDNGYYSDGGVEVNSSELFLLFVNNASQLLGRNVN